MNKDVDERLIPNGEYIDALNVRVLSSSGSDAGAVENERGNEKVTDLPETNNPVTIGSISDEANEKIYWFTVNDLGHSFIYEYDSKNTVTTVVLADTRSSNVLAFDKNYKITGVNIVYNIFNDKNLLLFTDGKNPPRCINIERAKGYAENGFEEEDISLYKKPPRKAPSIQPYNTSTVSENTVRERYFAFAYRYKYLDGEYSALSSFSNYQFVPGAFDIDYDTMENHGMLNIYNAYNITYNSGDKRVTDIQVVFKSTENENVYIIDTINKSDQSIQDNTDNVISFTNNKVYAALPEDEIRRIFDSVPLTAQAQEFIENRIIYGNVTDQYDLLETEGGNPIQADYSASHYILDSAGDELTETISANEQQITVDFTGIDFNEGYSLFVAVKVTSDLAGAAPNEYYDGNYEDSISVQLSENYASLTSFLASEDWTDFLTSLSLAFESSVETEPYPGATATTYGDFTLASSTSTSITLNAPTITYTTSGGSQTEQYKWDSETYFSVRESNSIVSLKSNRQYELGIAYLDKYGRYSSIIPISKNSDNRSSFNVPVSNSADINRAEISISNKAPYWADRYKVFIKGNKANHYNIFATIFYQDGVYRWVLLTGNNAQKVEEGDMLLVKSDQNGLLSNEVKVKVLEVVCKTALDIDTQSTDTDEGWLEGNEDPAGGPIKERYGTYMKIKPVGFNMQFENNLFSEYDNSANIGVGKAGQVETVLPNNDDIGLAKGIAQYLDTSTTPETYTNILLRKGTLISFDLLSYEGTDNNRNTYKKTYYTSKDYTGDQTESGLEKFLKEETGWYKPSGQNYYTNSADKFRLTFSANAVTGKTGVRHTLSIKSTEQTGVFQTARIEANIQIIVSPESLYVFETDPSDVDSEIYYETEETFDIVNGLHQGNIQNQTSSIPAIARLTVGNCFAFGNGVESTTIRDQRISPVFDFKTRPNIVLSDGYKRRKLESTLMYSGPKSITTSYNSLNEFNAARGISKTLDIKYGGIQKLFSRDSDLIVFQEDKVQKVLYGKSLIHSADGTASLTTIESVLGQEVPFPGDYGISKNPESFASFAGDMYFTDANRGTVLKLGGQGLSPISYMGMEGYFKDNLFEYKDSFNVGGYDPDNNEYVLSMNQSAKPEATPRVSCTSAIYKSLSSGDTYTYVIDIEDEGDMTFAYDVTGDVDIQIVSQATTDNNVDLTGTGTITFTVFPTDFMIDDVITVTITANADSSVKIDHTCPVLVTRTMDLTVINDINLAGDTIMTSYQVESGTEYGNSTLILDSSGQTLKQSYTSRVDSNQAPADGDTVTLRVTRIYGLHTGEFTSASSIGYLISDAEKTVSQIEAQATYPTVTYTKLSDRDVHSITFTFNETTADDKLYMIWSFEP